MTSRECFEAYCASKGLLPKVNGTLFEAWQAAERQALERAAHICDEYGALMASEKDSALLVGKVDLSNAMSGEPRAAEFLAQSIRALMQDASSGNDWTSVADRLPSWTDGRSSKTKVYVMARTVAGVEKECGYFLAGPDGAWDDHDYSPLHRVTHWKPIASSVASKEEPHP